MGGTTDNNHHEVGRSTVIQRYDIGHENSANGLVRDQVDGKEINFKMPAYARNAKRKRYLRSVNGKGVTMYGTWAMAEVEQYENDEEAPGINGAEKNNTVV